MSRSKSELRDHIGELVRFTKGVMGAGLAAQFKRKYPDMFRQYVNACRQGVIITGQVTFCYVGRSPRCVVLFPTKIHWRNPSQLEWIDTGLTELRKLVIDLEIRSIAIPPLGCGLGGLQWPDVRELIVKRLGDLTEVDVVLYVPKEQV